jgi:hypothetical protein
LYLRWRFPYYVDIVINEHGKKYANVHYWLKHESGIDTSWKNVWARWMVEDIYAQGFTGDWVKVGRKIENFRFYFARHQDAVFFKMVWGGVVG